MQSFLRSFSLSCLLATAAIAHADTVYTSAAAYNAATTITATATFGGIAPDGSYTNETSPFTDGGVTFTSAASDLIVIDPGFYFSSYTGGGFLSALYNMPVDLLDIAFPSSTAVSFNFGGLIGPDPTDPTAGPVTFLATLSNGSTFTFSTLDSIELTSSLAFIGFTTTNPITGLTLTLPDSPNYNAIDNVAYGQANASSVPEPSSLVLLGTGALTLIKMGRRRRRLAKQTGVGEFFADRP